MKKKNFTFPLSLDNIAYLVGNENQSKTEIEGVVMVTKTKDDSTLVQSIKQQIFKNVYDEWKSQRSVVVGDNKLLTQVNVVDYEIKEQASSIENLIVMRVKATVSIEYDPEYQKEIKCGLKSDSRLKF